MAKLENVIGYFIVQILALTLTYLFWEPAVGFISEMDGIFAIISSMVLIFMLIVGNIIGPLLVLNDEKLTERIRG